MRRGVGDPPDVRALGQLGDVPALLQHRPLEPPDALHRHLGGDRDLLGGLTRPDAGLDLARRELVLELDLELAQAGAVAAQRRVDALVERQRVRRAVGALEQQAGAVVAHSEQPEVSRPWARGCPCRVLASRSQRRGRCPRGRCRVETTQTGRRFPGTSAGRPATMPVMNRDDRDPGRVQLTVTQVFAGALAAMVGSLVASRLGVAGTVIGAAVISVVATVLTAINVNSVTHVKERAREARMAAARARLARNERGGRGGGRAPRHGGRTGRPPTVRPPRCPTSRPRCGRSPRSRPRRRRRPPRSTVGSPWPTGAATTGA